MGGVLSWLDGPRQPTYLCVFFHVLFPCIFSLSVSRGFVYGSRLKTLGGLRPRSTSVRELARQCGAQLFLIIRHLVRTINHRAG